MILMHAPSTVLNSRAGSVPGSIPALALVLVLIFFLVSAYTDMLVPGYSRNFGGREAFMASPLLRQTITIKCDM